MLVQLGRGYLYNSDDLLGCLAPSYSRRLPCNNNVFLTMPINTGETYLVYGSGKMYFVDVIIHEQRLGFSIYLVTNFQKGYQTT